MEDSRKESGSLGGRTLRTRICPAEIAEGYTSDEKTCCVGAKSPLVLGISWTFQGSGKKRLSFSRFRSF